MREEGGVGWAIFLLFVFCLFFVVRMIFNSNKGSAVKNEAVVVKEEKQRKRERHVSASPASPVAPALPE